jgi:DNA-binding SARP family transcriptional activator/TolB-like protein/Flp pilus assembly protein TadD
VVPDNGPRLRLRLFGHMAVEDSKGRNYLPRTRKARALLAILAMTSPKPVLRLRLAGLLWSRRQNEQARASLRQSVHELQDTLGPAWSHLFLTDRHHLSLRGDELDIDALALVHPLDGLQTLDPFETILLEDLGGLDPAFDHWLEEERSRFARIGRTIGENILAQCSDPVSAIDVAEQLLGIDRTHAGAWRAIMRSHAERGDLGAAVAAYDRCRSVWAERSGARPSPETEDLMGLVRKQSSWPNPMEPMGSVASPQAVYTPPRKPFRRERSTLRLRVAPFRVLGVERDDGLAIGLADEISAGLSRFRWISCVPASLWPKTSGEDGAEGGTSDDMEAELLLEGTIQHGGPRVRIVVRLLDMRVGGEIAWSGRFDRVMTDPLTLQDEVGAAIVAQIDPELMQHEGRRHAATRSNDMTARDLLLQALPAIYRLERDNFIDARRLLDMSLRADPGSSIAHGWLAYWNLLYVGQGWAPDPASSAADAAKLAERAVMLDPGDARALTLAGHVRGFLGYAAEASALHERALALNPNLALAWCFSGLAHFYMGRHEEALRRIQTAIRLSPFDPHMFFFDMALIMPYTMVGDYNNAVEAGRRAIELNPLFSSTYKGYLSALGLMGREHEARDILNRLLALEPAFSIKSAVSRSPLIRPEDINRYADGLRRSGLPETADPVNSPQLALAIEH